MGRAGASYPIDSVRTGATWAAGAINAQTTAAQTFPLPGARIGDLGFASSVPTASGLVVNACSIVVDDQITVNITNTTAGPLNPGALALQVGSMPRLIDQS